MREIQELTLSQYSSAGVIDQRFATRSAEFTAWLRDRRSDSNPVIGGIRASAISLSSIPPQGRLFDRQELFLHRSGFQASVGQNQLELRLPGLGFDTRPLVRGIRRFSDGNPTAFRYELFEDGALDYWFSWDAEEGRGDMVFMSWILATMINIVLAADHFRSEAGAPDEVDPIGRTTDTGLLVGSAAVPFC